LAFCDVRFRLEEDIVVFLEEQIEVHLEILGD
jgi:hypothetical protein